MSDSSFSLSRRRLLQAGAALSGAMLLPGLMGSVWAAGSDKPELDTVRVGFIPLTDCAPVVMAALKGFDKKYGIRILPSKEASWAAVRDKLVSGELDAAHALYGLIYGLELGIAGKAQPMATLMTLNQNGQAISLSADLLEKGITTPDALQKLIAASEPGAYTFAHTFPTGTHAMWLYYWLAAAGIHPFNDVRTVVVPPPQMVMNMRIGNMVGFCVASRGTPAPSTTASVSPPPPRSPSSRITRKKCSAPAACGWSRIRTPPARSPPPCWRPPAG